MLCSAVANDDLGCSRNVFFKNWSRIDDGESEGKDEEKCNHGAHDAVRIEEHVVDLVCDLCLGLISSVGFHTRSVVYLLMVLR